MLQPRPALDSDNILAATTPSQFLSAWLRNGALLPPTARETFLGYYHNFGDLSSARLRWAYDRQLEEISCLVAERPGQQVLEVGAGCGTESLWFAKLGGCVTSIDIREDRLAVACARRSALEGLAGRKFDCRFERKNLLEMPGSDQFDLVWVQQTFHHLEPRAACVDAIVRLLRPGGRAVISEVNAWNPLIQLMLLRRRGLNTLTSYEDIDGNHVQYGNERILPARTLTRWFCGAGLVEPEVRYYRLLPSHPAFDRFTGLERRAASWPLMPLFTHYNFVARKPG
jgi:2-polyprenyl-3-methyl-5-hydroxy-6-metoxy-1,4-benzoquinol methylase